MICDNSRNINDIDTKHTQLTKGIMLSMAFQSEKPDVTNTAGRGFPIFLRCHFLIQIASGEILVFQCSAFDFGFSILIYDLENIQFI